MKISKKWLSQYMDLGDLSMDEVARKITDAGFEVEGVEPQSSGTNLTIGKVISCKPHPDSDHLHVTEVDLGDEIVQIVCGAPNVAEGQKVIVAKPGAVLPGGVIKAGKIRNVESNGMICALFELGVDKHLLRQDQIDGIEILDEDAPIGHPDPLGYLGYDDVILDVSLTPNRADCLAAFNMALETGAVLNVPVRLPDFEGAAKAGDDHPTNLQIQSETEGCPAFLGKVIGSVTIKESPEWMKELLRASGVHSINNVVDISNIVMLETGQPMHFYDIDAITDQEITVREGFHEPYTALDGVEYELLPEDLVITNKGKPIGIAGIMGGNDSKIEENTRGLIIECAAFDHVRIRNTARRLNLNTEASVRYQKGIEPLAAQKAMDRAVQLLIEYADAKDIEKTVVYETRSFEPKTITVSVERINRHLGTDFSADEVLDVFSRLHFEPVQDNDLITVTIPSYRTDIERMEDLSEEVIRMIGYDRLPSTLPLMEMTEGKLDDKQQMVRYIRQSLLNQGLQDCVTYTLVSDQKDTDAILSAGDSIPLASMLSEERKRIRTSILPSLLDVLAYNKARSAKDVNLFEISDLTAANNSERHLAIALCGSLEYSRWMGYRKDADFFVLKGMIEDLLERYGISESRIQFKENKTDVKHFHPYRSAEIWIGKKLVGLMGQIHPDYAYQTNTVNIISPVVMAELNLSAILELKKAKIRFTPISRYPAVTRDMAFAIKRTVPAQKILDIVHRAGKLGKENIVKNVEIFDVYEGKHIADDERSIALSVTYQSDKQTLDDKQISEVFEKTIKEIENQTHAVLRSAK